VGKSIILWRESYAAFGIVTASFLLWFVMFWIPWLFLIAWACGIFVWVLLGPWMKLVDIFYVRKYENLSAEETLQLTFQGRYHKFAEQTSRRKVIREQALKLQAMKTYMFGQQVCIEVFVSEAAH
jgi:predicted membrane protein